MSFDVAPQPPERLADSADKTIGRHAATHKSSNPVIRSHQSMDRSCANLFRFFGLRTIGAYRVYVPGPLHRGGVLPPGRVRSRGRKLRDMRTQNPPYPARRMVGLAISALSNRAQDFRNPLPDRVFGAYGATGHALCQGRLYQSQLGRRRMWMRARWSSWQVARLKKQAPGVEVTAFTDAIRRRARTISSIFPTCVCARYSAARFDTLHGNR